MSHKRPSLKIVQCNLAHYQAANTDFINQCVTENIDIALVQEPYVSNLGFARTTYAHVYQRHLPESEVRACILVFNKDLNVIFQSEHSTPYIATIDVKLGTSLLTFCSVYQAPKTDVNPTLHRLSVITATRNRVVIGGDFNAKHQAWNCTSSDTNGQNIFGFSTSSGFEVLNTGNAATFDAIRAGVRFTSIVDVTLVSHHLADSVQDWRIDTDFTPLSDHHALRFEIQLNAEETPTSTSTYKYRSKKANWPEFEKHCIETVNEQKLCLQIEGVTNIEDLDAAVEDLTTLIQNACDKWIPIRKAPKRKVQCFFWTEELNNRKANVIRLRNILNRRLAGTPDEVTEYVNAKEAYAIAI